MSSFITSGSAQRTDTINPVTESVYRVKTVYEGIGGLALALGSSVGIEDLREKDPISQETLDRLVMTGVSRIDRWGLRQDASKRARSEEVSDMVFNATLILPLTLFVKKKFRKDWLDISVMYLEAHALSSFMYAYSPLGPKVIDRYRPVAYFPESDDVTFDDRAAGNNRNSFFSGHVSTTAVGTFFFTKVLSDYNPQWRGYHRAIAYTLATLPPAFVAVQRVRALKHFPTDTAVGLAVGAFLGVMVPQVHKSWARNHRSKISLGGGYSQGAGSGGFVLTF